MAQIAVGTSRRRDVDNTQPVVAYRPTEGWVTLLLHVVIIAMTANSVVRIEQHDRSAVLIPLAIGGLLLGALVARVPALDAASHVVALLAGIVVSALMCAVNTDGARATWDARGRNAFELGRRVVETQVHLGPDRLSDSDLVFVIGVTLWLVGYSSAWMLYRRHWLMPALMVPAVLVFINLRFEDGNSTKSVAVFSICALIMAARHQAFVRQTEWSGARVPNPRELPAKFTVCGSAVAVAALLLGWVLPFQSSSGLVERLSDQSQSGWERLAREWNAHVGASNSSPGISDIYSTFADSFVIGGQFTPTNDPVAKLAASQPAYLAARRYDVYNGVNWSSSIDDTFRMEGEPPDVKATNIYFKENQDVALTADVNRDRDRVGGVITVLDQQNGLLLTIDTYASASIPTVTELGWSQFGPTQIDFESVDIATLPVELQGLISDLQAATFVPDPTTREPVAEDPIHAQEIQQDINQLGRYPVNVELSFGDDGHVLLIVSGRLPNYDDIEAVFAANPNSVPGSYGIIGTGSVADEAALRTAGTAYPEWVSNRYLQLPEGITDETIQLAEQVIANSGASNSFDKAWAIQEYLHNTYDYALNSDQTPAGRDAVDFFLFGKKVGRCEEYATAMVVMLRTQGIPARLVGGYRAGEETDENGEYIYRGKQAHTWVEVYFPAYGWIPFEPTKGQQPFDYSDDQAAAIPTPADDPFNVERAASPEPQVTPEPSATPTGAPITATVDSSDGGSSFGFVSKMLGLIAIGLTLGAALFVGGFVVFWGWSLRGLRPGAALYARLMRIGNFWGIDTNPTKTPREYAAEFGQVVPKAGRAARYVAELYTAERYGGIEISEEAQQGGRLAWRSVRSGMLAWRPWKRSRRGG